MKRKRIAESSPKNTTENAEHVRKRAAREFNEEQTANFQNVINNLEGFAQPLEDGADNLISELIHEEINYVLMGESTHGTEEFYQIRSQITRNLVSNFKFKIILVEGDWPSLYRVNQYISHDPESKDTTAMEALSGIQHYPTWMWKNNCFKKLVEWLREYNKEHSDEMPVRVLGMDCYQLLKARVLILEFLERVGDTEFYNEVKKKLKFMEKFTTEQEYGYSLVHGIFKHKQEKIQETLAQLLSKFQWEKIPEYKEKPGINLFELIMTDQCFEILVSGDEYYRKMYSEPRGSQATWNVRDQHMTMTVMKIKELFENIYNYQDVRMVLWAHNSHLGDARAGHRGGEGFQLNETWNVGQMVRSTMGEDKTRIIGFSTYNGFVRASPEWDTPSKKFKLRKALRYSSPWFCHQVTEQSGLNRFYLNFDQLNVIEDKENFMPQSLPCKYRYIVSRNTVSEGAELDSSKVTEEVNVDDTFIAVERKIVRRGTTVRLKRDDGKWVTEFVNIGGVQKYCLPADAQIPEDLGEFFGAYRLQRLIGVNYKPETELQSHYSETVWAKQYDCVIYVDKTNELKPIRKDLSKFMGIKRLKKEYRSIVQHPMENIEACPSEDNLFEWYYVIKGMHDPYAGGAYLGKLIFPKEYPLKPPKIQMLTPNGRFKTGVSICLSMSSYHPELWNPTWTVESILVGLYSFMIEDTPTTGSVQTSEMTKRLLAKESVAWCKENEIFDDLFGDILDQTGKVRKNIAADVEESDYKCRYCLKEDEPENLISPCKCKGGLKWVHLKCLKNWQQSILINQSTNPNYQTDIASKCNVCLSEFSEKPQDRYEAMLEYTGETMAALLRPGGLILSEKLKSEKQTKLLKDPRYQVDDLIWSLSHWIYGVFLITQVVEYEHRDDTVLGVNMTRPVPELPRTIPGCTDRFRNPIQIRRVYRKKYSNFIDHPKLNVNFYIGGPCEPEVCQAVSIVPEADEILLKSHGLSLALTDSGQSAIYGELSRVGEWILQFVDIPEGQSHDINGCIGYAGWSRTQLLGEMSRRSWLVAESSMNDFATFDNLWQRIHDSGRCIIARHSEFVQASDDDDDDEEEESN